MDKKSLLSFILKTAAAVLSAVAAFIAGSNLSNL